MLEAVKHSPQDRQAEIVKALEEDIIFGRLPPGARLIEDTLMLRFGVTRHFIRQALSQLDRMGIVTREKNKGVAVRILAPEEVRQIYQVREMLQRQAALLIPLPAPARLLQQLEAIHEVHCRHSAAGFLSGVHEANDQFHLTMFAACGNPYLVQSIKDYMWLSLPVRAKSMADPDMLNASCTQHELMLKMLRGHDRWTLAELCVDHVQPSKSDYLARAQRNNETALPRPERRTENQPGAT